MFAKLCPFKHYLTLSVYLTFIFTFQGSGVSPDCIAQLALQLAFTRLYGHHAVTHEACSTGTFLHGRTETFRPATTEALECCKVFCADSPRHGLHRTTLLRKLIEATSQQHKQLISEAATGRTGVRMRDIHGILGDVLFSHGGVTLATYILGGPIDPDVGRVDYEEYKAR